MKKSFIEWGMGGVSIPTKVRQIKQAGFDCVSLHPFFSSAEEEAETIKAVKETGLGVTFHTSNEPAADILKKLGGYIKTVTAFQESTKNVGCFSIDQYHKILGDFKVLDRDTMKAVILELIKKMPPLGIKVAVENGSCLTSRDEFLTLAGFAGTKDFGMLLDLGHMNLKWLRGEVPIDDYIYSLPLEIFELHVHDNDGETDQHQLLGKGNLDLKAAVSALKRRKFDGVATFEMGGEQNIGPEWLAAISDSREQFLNTWQS